MDQTVKNPGEAMAADAPPRPLVVGVGASAGGLEALQTFLRHVPPGRGLSFVVVFHLDPNAKSFLPELLAKAALFPVIEVADGMPVETDRVYTAPGHSLVLLENGVLRLVQPARAEERRTAIDRFLLSLAKDQGDRAVAVVLSGAGSDGSLGLKAVADAGGLTMVQDPATAKHDSMPLSASELTAADHILSPDRLAEELLAYARHIAAATAPDREADLYREVADALPQVCEILLQATGHNFKHYKASTLTRRTLRRILVLRVENVRDYLERLRADPAEADRLFKELLINVTAFFRDPEAFNALEAEVLPRLFANRGSDESVRVWVPGCATGEEAYTLAMLLRERLDGLATPPEVQVFATDIDEPALVIARQGSYPLGIADEISPDRLKRFFVKKGQQYHIAKEVRELVLFSNHNLINDPPFSKLDLISCRNLLIYLGAHLQKKLIPLFHYALRPGGYLFLGPSESLSTHRELFRPVDAKSRISQRIPTAIRSASFLTGRSGLPTSLRTSNAPSAAEADTYLVMQRIVLDEFAPKAVVVNEEGQVVSASGNLEKYLTVTAGAFHNSITRLVRDGLRVGLRAALAESAKVRRKVVHEGLSLRTDAGVQRVMLTVQPMPQMGEDSGLFMVVFQDVGRPLAPEALPYTPPTEEAAALIEQLERELGSTRDDLEKTVQDLEAVNEELKSSNEELLSMNEELQSSNEELETSKEEVQAANDALIGSNSDLENLLASIRIATLFLDDAGNVRRVTPAASTIYNLTPADIGRPLDHFTHKAVFMAPLPLATVVHRADKPFEDEVEMRDGLWYLRRVLPYRTADGVNEGIVVTFTDVTERKRAEEALRESEHRLQFVMDSMPQKIFTAAVNGDVIYFNPQWMAFTGLSFEQIQGWGWTQFIHLEDVEENVRVWRQSVETGESFLFEHRFRRADGVYRWHISRAVPLRDDDGRIVLWVGSNTDIHDFKLAEQALREIEQRLAQVFRLAPSFMCVLRGPEHVFERANEQFFYLVGNRDILGKSVVAALPEMADQAFPQLLDDAYRTGEAYVGTGVPVTLQREPGHPPENRYVDFVYQPLRSSDGAVSGILVHGIDLTDRKRAEDALREADRRKDEFLATLAHELRNPLAPIRNAVQVLRHLGPQEPAIQNARDIIERQVNHMVRLVDDLLDVSRISWGKIDLRKERLDAEEIVYNAIETSRPLIEIGRHELTVVLPPQPLFVEGDLTRLAQVLANLLNNAAKYTPEGGRLTVTVERDGEWAVFRIRDNGLGIPPVMMPRIFEMFTQVDKHLDRSQGGLGIGLTLVRRLIEMHGGTVEAHSEGSNRGSEFVVRLPLALDDAASLRAEEGFGKAERTGEIPIRRILVVDDNRDSADSLGLLLEIFGNEVLTVHDGPSALEAAKAFRPDIVLLDIGLPGMNGHDVAREMRRMPEVKDAVLIAQTGWGQEDDRRRSKEAGFDHHLVKPVDPAALKKLLESLEPKR